MKNKTEAMKKVFLKSAKDIEEWGLKCEVKRMVRGFQCMQRYMRGMKGFLDVDDLLICKKTMNPIGQECLNKNPKE